MTHAQHALTELDLKLASEIDALHANSYTRAD
jgi:pterin-4a-carbinolamine dehydratase